MISFCCVLFWIQLFYVVFLEWICSLFAEILVILSLLLVALPRCLIPETDCSSWPKIIGCLMWCASFVPEWELGMTSYLVVILLWVTAVAKGIPSLV